MWTEGVESLVPCIHFLDEHDEDLQYENEGYESVGLDHT
jgi:hypothetical protein